MAKHRTFGAGLKIASGFSLVMAGVRPIRSNTRKRNVMKYMIIILTLIFSFPTFSCGTTVNHFSSYPKAFSKTDKEEFFRNHSCVITNNYLPHEADPIIASTIVDAIKSDVDTDLIKMILKNYNCVYGARHLPIYKAIKDLITEEKYSTFCNLERLNNIYIIKAKKSLVLRESANIKANVIHSLPYGIHIEVINNEGNWAYVKTSYGNGYVFNKYISPY